MKDKIERARLIATFVHHDQKRQDGEEYINHCERIFDSLTHDLLQCIPCTGDCKHTKKCKLTSEIENLICAAWLHDCMEDAPTEWGMNDFILHIFGYDIWDIVITLTHDKKLETYNEYLIRVFKHPIAWKIKWLDMIDNTSYQIPIKQREKYRDACVMLMLHNVTVPNILKERLGLK